MTLATLKGLADLMGVLGRYRKLRYFKGFNLLIGGNGVNRRLNFLWWVNVRSNMYFTVQSFRVEYLAPSSTLVHEFVHLYVVILNNESARGNKASTTFGDEIFPTENINKRKISSILCTVDSIFPQFMLSTDIILCIGMFYFCIYPHISYFFQFPCM